MRAIADSIFIQYLNPEILSLYQVKKNQSYFNLCIEITKYASLIVGDKILMPTSYLSESEYIKDYIITISPIIKEGLLYRICPIPSLDEFVKIKTSTYRIGDNIREKYSQDKQIQEVQNERRRKRE
jgi:hypothetical protein